MEHLSLLLFLLLFPICSSQVYEAYAGTMMTYYPQYNVTDGSITVEIRYKSSSKGCFGYAWGCLSVDCGADVSWLWYFVDNAGAEICQLEAIWIKRIPTATPFQLYHWWNSGHFWITPLVNAISHIKALTLVELRNRSDTGQFNRPPLTTILPIIRVPSNCQRDIRLLAFDPDGDLVKCRYADNNTHPFECAQCTPPSVLGLSLTCILSFNSTNDSSVGRYAVQLMMEDFPRTNIILSAIGNNGIQTEVKPTTSSISKIPLQFVFSVEPAAPSCTEGLYLPRFVEPTPEHGAQLSVNVSQTLQIYIKAEANVSMISDILFSGPHSITKANSGGQYILSWAPSAAEDGNSYPLCFIAEAVLNTTKYHSELRCVAVMVGDVPPPATTSLPAASTTPPALTTTPVFTTTPPALTTTPVFTTTPPALTTPVFTTPAKSAATTSFSSAISTTTNLTPTSSKNTAPPSETTTNAKTGDSLTVRAFMKARISSSVPLSEEVMQTTVLQKFTEELVKRGLPPDIALRILNSTSAATSAGLP